MLSKNIVSHEGRMKVIAMIKEKIRLEKLAARKIEIEYNLD